MTIHNPADDSLVTDKAHVAGEKDVDDAVAAAKSVSNLLDRKLVSAAVHTTLTILNPTEKHSHHGAKQPATSAQPS